MRKAARMVECFKARRGSKGQSCAAAQPDALQSPLCCSTCMLGWQTAGGCYHRCLGPLPSVLCIEATKKGRSSAPSSWTVQFSTWFGCLQAASPHRMSYITVDCEIDPACRPVNPERLCTLPRWPQVPSLQDAMLITNCIVPGNERDHAITR